MQYEATHSGTSNVATLCAECFYPFDYVVSRYNGNLLLVVMLLSPSSAATVVRFFDAALAYVFCAGLISSFTDFALQCGVPIASQ